MSCDENGDWSRIGICKGNILCGILYRGSYASIDVLLNQFVKSNKMRVLIDEMVGPDALTVGFTCWISLAPVFCFVYC